MKIALYLGSFNPFHLGHLEVVKSALVDFKMDEVIIVPTMQSPWKWEKPLDIKTRRMLIYRSCQNLVAKPHPHYTCGVSPLTCWVGVSLIEEELIPPYYSYATLHALKNKYCNDEIFVLCGKDTIKDIPEWMNGEQIIKDYNFLVVDRPENSISSSEIRNIIKTDKNAETTLKGKVSSNIINDLIKFYKV